MSFHGPNANRVPIVACKGCQKAIPAGVRSVPNVAIAVRCPLCREHRQYRPSEVYEGRAAFQATLGGGHA